MKRVVNVVLSFLKYTLITLISVLTLVAFTNFFQLKILNQEYPNFFGYSVFKVITNSMAPAIKTNDIIIVKIGDKAEAGDVITYKKENAYITHRVTKVEEKLYIAKGDANNVGDKPVLKENVVGRVIKVFKNLGIWKEILFTPKVFILLVITLFLFNDSFQEWTKMQYHRYKDFRITKDSIIEEVRVDEKKK